MIILKDSKERIWKVEINIGSAVTVASNLNLDLYKPSLVDDLKTPSKIVDLLYVLLVDQVIFYGMTDVEFAKFLSTKQNFNDFHSALVDAVAEFFPVKVVKEEQDEEEEEKDAPPEKPAEVSDLIWQIAGRMRMDPRPYSLRQLLSMYRAYDKDNQSNIWIPTALLASSIYRAAGHKAKSTDFLPKNLKPKKHKPKPDPILGFDDSVSV